MTAMSRLTSRLRPPPDKTVQFLILVSFLIWFIIWRLYLLFIPPLFFTVWGNHIHHYSYGIILLSILSFIFLAYPPSYKWRLRFSVLLGVALAFAYDEFAMWLLQGDYYHYRLNYDAIVIIALLILNTIYFQNFWLRWGRRLTHLLNIIFLGVPRLLRRSFQFTLKHGSTSRKIV